MRYVKEHSDIPVPGIFYSDLDPSNAVGAPYVLMETLHGKPLIEIWDNLNLDHKKSVITQIAGVLGQLARLNFDEIGSLQDEEIGPLHLMYWEGDPRGPFKTAEDFLLSFVNSDHVEDEELRAQYDEMRSVVRTAAASSLLQPPFPLIHVDFDRQNMLFTHEDKEAAPVLTGIIDWDYAHTGPLYYLFDYPTWIQDIHYLPNLYAENKVLRQEFARALQQYYPNDAAMREKAWRCLQEKTYVLNQFHGLFVSAERDESQVDTLVENYLEQLHDGTGLAYDGRLNYEPDEVEGIEIV